MTQLDIASQGAATLETAPTLYIEGHGIRFAYRRLGPATGTALVLLPHFPGEISARDPTVVNAQVADFNCAVSIGRERMRLPVAAKMALVTAGETIAVAASPKPPGASALLTIWVSTIGASLIRIGW